MNKCPICEAQHNESNYFEVKGVQGYLEGSAYTICECLNCQTQFIKDKYDKKIYDIIYGQRGDFGYDRYGKYVEEIKAQPDPLNWLSLKEPAYLYVEQYVRGKKPLLILEVGCGEGYLTYALKKAGHQVVGIDISKEAISKAIESFGNNYQAIDIKDYKPNVKFDLIVCTETIEHLADPLKFISECRRLLSYQGSILFTTPNKDYRSPNTIWQTEAPPVHRFWFGHKSFEAMAERTGLTLTFLELRMPVEMERNNLVAYLSSRGSNRFGNVLDKDGKVNESKPSFFRNSIRSIVMWTPVRFLCNAFFKTKQPPTLGVLLSHHG